MSRKARAVGVSFSLALFLMSSPSIHAQSDSAPGILTFTEDFSDTTFKDSALTNANWSTDEQAAFLAWNSRLSNGDETELSAGSETDMTRNIVLGDVNNDGALDLLVGNLGQANMLYLNLNNGSGSFSTSGITIGAVTPVEADSSRSLVLGDVDGDGDLDLIVGNSNQQANKLYLNNGGSFSSSGIVIDSDSDDTYSVNLGDIDSDGDLDLIAGNYGQTNKLYLNNGSGSFSANGIAIGSSMDNTSSSVLLDVNNDGNLDLVVGNDSLTVVNKLYINNGSGGFPSAGFPVGLNADNTSSLVAGDVDGDGDIDIVAGNRGQANKLYLNAGGIFGSGGISIGVNDALDGATSLALGDVDGDGDIDLIVANEGAETKRYLNDGSGGFPDSGEIVGGSSASINSYSTAVGDVDGDGDLDILTGDNNATTKLYLNAGRGGFSLVGIAIGAESDNTMVVVLGDVDGVNGLDLIAGNAGQTNKLYLNDGSGSFPDDGVDIGSETDITYSLALADVDGDSDLDLLVANWGATNKVYLNDGNGIFPATGTAIGDPANPDVDTTTSIALIDVNGDSSLDVITGNWGGTNKFYLNNGSGVFSASGTDIGSEADNTLTITVGDVDGTSGLDLITGNSGQENKLYLHNGASGFLAATNIGADTDDTRSMVLGDIDGVSGPDLVVGNSGGSNKVYLNVNSFPVSGAGAAIGTETDVTTSVVLMDVDGDGDQDLLAGNYAEPNKRYLNDGSGGFSTMGAAFSLDNNTTTRGLVLGDMDGDGDEDLVAAEYGLTNKLYRNIIYQPHLGRVVSQKINGTETNIRDVVLTVSDSVNSATTRNTRIEYYLSNSGGVKWHRVRAATTFTFPDVGTDDLRWKVEMFSLSPVRTPLLNKLTIEVNSAPVITSDGGGATASISVEENQTVVTIVKADDDEGVLTFGITGGADADKFTINSSSGKLSFIDPPDFDQPTDSNGDNIYHVRVTVEDGGAGNTSDTQELYVTVTEAIIASAGGGGGGASAIGWLVMLLGLTVLRYRQRGSSVSDA
ncbi:MAG TPA: hypothetical protein ENJ13_05565 [Chromatiales bacterium]|nr:hypothetical protein [Chromatiales bacterium]